MLFLFCIRLWSEDHKNQWAYVYNVNSPLIPNHGECPRYLRTLLAMLSVREYLGQILLTNRWRECKNKNTQKENSREWCDSQRKFCTIVTLWFIFFFESHGIGEDTPAYLIMGRGIKKGSRVLRELGGFRLRLKMLGVFRLRGRSSTAPGVRTETEGAS